jgi:hypothetical protein
MRKGFAKLSAVALGLLLATTVASASEQGRFEKSLNVTGAADLQVFTRSGDVTIRSGPAGTIGIIGHIHVGNRWFSDKKADVEDIERNPPIQQSGNNIRIDYVNHQNISIDYEITAPADTKVRTKSGSGDQTIEGMHAGIDIETGSGDVRLTDLAGDLRIQTGSGNVEHEALRGLCKRVPGAATSRSRSEAKVTCAWKPVRETLGPGESMVDCALVPAAATCGWTELPRTAGRCAPARAMPNCACPRRPRLISTSPPVLAVFQ